MPEIKKFLGQQVLIPEDRYYYPQQGLWARVESQDLLFGLTEPFLILAGGFNEVDWLVEEGRSVQAGEAVIFAITGKILYLDTPVSGTIRFNSAVKAEQSLVIREPYGRGWLFGIRTELAVEQALRHAVDAREYLISLKGSEGFRNPEGLKGGVSGICKAVYTGIRGQKFS